MGDVDPVAGKASDGDDDAELIVEKPSLSVLEPEIPATDDADEIGYYSQRSRIPGA